MLQKRTWIGLAIVGVLVIGGVASWLALTSHSPVGPTTARLASGQAIYAEQCATCHGANLEGQPNWRERLPNGRLPAPPHDVSGHTWHHPDSDLFALTKYGPSPFAPAGYQSDMPAFADKLTDRQIHDVLAYIKSTWPPEIQAKQTAISQRVGMR